MPHNLFLRSGLIVRRCGVEPPSSPAQVHGRIGRRPHRPPRRDGRFANGRPLRCLAATVVAVLIALNVVLLLTVFQG
jgi:Mn2+/Fe2+ NRAMP family transporter